jgi:hypothetical protein
MIAAHPHDLRAARENGLRPLEFGPGGDLESPDPSFDLVVDDFVELDRDLAG